jgi:hypothetical protein
MAATETRGVVYFRFGHNSRHRELWAELPLWVEMRCPFAKVRTLTNGIGACLHPRKVFKLGVMGSIGGKLNAL